MLIKIGPKGVNTSIHLIHWCRVTLICVTKLITIGSNNGLSPDRRQAIIWTLETIFREILIEIDIFSLKKMHLNISEMAAILSRSQCVNTSFSSRVVCLISDDATQQQSVLEPLQYEYVIFPTGDNSRNSSIILVRQWYSYWNALCIGPLPSFYSLCMADVLSVTKEDAPII